MAPTSLATVASAGAASGAVAGTAVGGTLAAQLMAAGADVQTIMAAVITAGAQAGAKAGADAGSATHVWDFADNAIAGRGYPWPGAQATELSSNAGAPLNTPATTSDFTSAPAALTPQPVKLKTV